MESNNKCNACLYDKDACPYCLSKPNKCEYFNIGELTSEHLRALNSQDGTDKQRIAMLENVVRKLILQLNIVNH